MGDEIFEVRGTVSMPYEWGYGKMLTDYFEATSRKKIYGKRCPKCGGVQVPPYESCGRCYVRTDEEMIELPGTGKLAAFTVVYLPFPGQPNEPPYAYGNIIFDGGDTYFMHLIKECPFEELKVGMPLEPVWNPEPKGDLYDILYFRPIKE